VQVTLGLEPDRTTSMNRSFRWNDSCVGCLFCSLLFTKLADCQGRGANCLSRNQNKNFSASWISRAG
jgi:hypothetical protein